MAEESPISSVLKNFTKMYGLENKLYTTKIKSDWHKIVGPIIAKNTSHIEFKGSFMFVEIDSAPLKNEMVFMRKQLIEKINQYIQRPVIQKIIIK